MATAVQIPMGPLTYADLQHLPDDGLRYELRNGDLLMSPSPIIIHQLASIRLTALLLDALPKGYQLLTAPTDWFVDDYNVFVPDLLVMRLEDFNRKLFTGTPALVVEILSPSTRRRDLNTKRRAYEEAGLEWYWTLDLDRPALQVFRSEEGRLTEEAHVVNDGVCRAETPFAVEVIPADLVRDPT